MAHLEKVLFTDVDKNVIRVKVELEGKLGNPSKFVQFRGKLYEHKGGGLTASFYHEVEKKFQIVECDKDYTRSEFLKLE